MTSAYHISEKRYSTILLFLSSIIDEKKMSTMDDVLIDMHSSQIRECNSLLKEKGYSLHYEISLNRGRDVHGSYFIKDKNGSMLMSSDMLHFENPYNQRVIPNELLFQGAISSYIINFDMKKL